MGTSGVSVVELVSARLSDTGFGFAAPFADAGGRHSTHPEFLVLSSAQKAVIR